MPRWSSEGRRTFNVHDCRIEPTPETGCWLWTGVINGSGYGRVGVGGVLLMAHRVFWERANGSIPDGMLLDHLCRVRSCCNPDHLRLVTPKVNVTENSESVVASQARQTHCKRGHPLSGDNLRIVKNRSSRSRVCRTCRRTFEATPEYRVRANSRRRKHITEDVTDAP